MGSRLGISTEKLEALNDYATSPLFSAAEKVALEYADLFANNHFAITDAHYAKLSKFFSEQEIVELGLFSAYFLGYGRFLSTLNIVEELPTALQDKSRKVAPWETRESVVVDDTDPRNM